MFLFFLFLISYPGSLRAADIQCQTLYEDRVRGIRVSSEEGIYKIEDTNHPEFHGTGVFDSSGTLRISFFLKTNAGDKSAISETEWVPKIYKFFNTKKGRVKRVEYTLAKLQEMDDFGRKRSEDPTLDKFNDSYIQYLASPRAKLLGDSGVPSYEIEEKAKQYALAQTAVGFYLIPQGFRRVTIKDPVGKIGSAIRMKLIFEKD